MSFNISQSTEQYAIALQNNEEITTNKDNTNNKEAKNNDKSSKTNDSKLGTHLHSYSAGITVSVEDSEDVY